MTTACSTRIRPAYESGRLQPNDPRLFRPGNLKLTAHAIEAARLTPGARILDLGCGAGDTLRALLAGGFHVIGVDCAADPFPAHALDPCAGKRIVATAEALPLPDQSFDAVLAECSFSLFRDQKSALQECARVLVNGGTLIVSDLYARQPEAIAAVRALRGSCVAGMLVPAELDVLLTAAGFTVRLWEDHSRSLRECTARYLFEHGSLDGLWNCSDASSDSIQCAMRAARTGYFLLIAIRSRRNCCTGISQ